VRTFTDVDFNVAKFGNIPYYAMIITETFIKHKSNYLKLSKYINIIINLLYEF